MNNHTVFKTMHLVCCCLLKLRTFLPLTKNTNGMREQLKDAFNCFMAKAQVLW